MRRNQCEAKGQNAENHKPKTRDKGSQGMANNILRCWRCKGKGKINSITTCIVCQGKGTIFTSSDCRQKGAERREILLDLVKRKNVTNGKLLRYINWYSEMYFYPRLYEIGGGHEPPPITERQRQKAQSLIQLALKKFRNREKLRSASARRRRKITKGKVIKLKKVKCELCGRRRKLVLHHLIPIHMGGEHVKENLIAVCKECHSSQLLHGGIWKSYEILKAVRRYKGKHKRVEILRGILARWKQGKKIIVRGGNLYQRYAARISEETTKAS